MDGDPSMTTTASDLPRSETVTMDGWVVTRGCALQPATGRWQPSVSIRRDWGAEAEAPVPVTAADQQDTPELALERADLLARQWLTEHPPCGGVAGLAWGLKRAV